VTWAWSPIKFQADMGILLTFMFVWNMLGALILIPALSHFLLRGETKPGLAILPQDQGAPAEESLLAEERPVAHEVGSIEAVSFVRGGSSLAKVTS